MLIQPDAKLKEKACVTGNAENRYNGKWMSHLCDEKKPYVCMYTDENDEVFPCKWKGGGSMRGIRDLGVGQKGAGA